MTKAQSFIPPPSRLASEPRPKEAVRYFSVRLFAKNVLKTSHLHVSIDKRQVLVETRPPQRFVPGGCKRFTDPLMTLLSRARRKRPPLSVRLFAENCRNSDVPARQDRQSLSWSCTSAISHRRVSIDLEASYRGDSTAQGVHPGRAQMVHLAPSRLCVRPSAGRQRKSPLLARFQ
jgi:hypothetical protein